MFPIVASQAVLSFPGHSNDPITYTNAQHLKQAKSLEESARIRPDERGSLQKLWDWCCLGGDYNAVTRDADQTLWALLHGENDPLEYDPVELFEHLRDQVTEEDRNKFVYLALDPDGVVRFSLNDVDEDPIHFEAAPQKVRACITANLWAPTQLEQAPEAQIGQSNLDQLTIYQIASDPTRAMLERLARPATGMAICRALDAQGPDAELTEMADPGMPVPAPERTLLEAARRTPPRFTLSALQNGLTRADMRYADASGWLDVSFLIREPRHPGAPIEETLQCIFVKYTPL